MSDQESRREDFVRGDHDVVPTVTIMALLTLKVTNNHPDGEVIFAEEFVTSVLEDIADQYADIDGLEILEFEIVKTEVN